jgi:hypothetical protein
MSRERSEQLAAPLPGQRGGEDDGGVLLVGRAAHDGVDLLAVVHVIVAGVADGVALDAVDGVAGDELTTLGIAQDRAEDHERLPGGAGAFVAVLPALDLPPRDRVQRPVAEGREEVVAHQLPVFAQRRLLEAALAFARAPATPTPPRRTGGRGVGLWSRGRGWRRRGSGAARPPRRPA